MSSSPSNHSAEVADQHIKKDQLQEVSISSAESYTSILWKGLPSEPFIDDGRPWDDGRGLRASIDGDALIKIGNESVLGQKREAMDACAGTETMAVPESPEQVLKQAERVDRQLVAHNHEDSGDAHEDGNEPDIESIHHAARVLSVLPSNEASLTSAQLRDLYEKQLDQLKQMSIRHGNEREQDRELLGTILGKYNEQREAERHIFEARTSWLVKELSKLHVKLSGGITQYN